MRSNMWKSTFREIKQSFGRFMAIFAIVVLGVSLFAGLKVLQPAMVKTTNEYFKEKEFYNYRVMSTLGYEQEDLEFLAEQEDVRFAEGAVSFDILCSTGDESEKVVKVYNLPERINAIELLSGRMPEKANECIVDSAMFTEESIGEKIVLADDNEEDDLENFAYKEYTIVGIAQSPNYIQFERGNTSLGNGKISGFMYIPMEGFDADFFTEILVKFDEDYTIYSDEYEAYMDEKEAVWEDLAQEAADGRYDRLMAEAQEELADAKQELADGKAEGEAELEDARIELADAYKELTDAEKEIADAKQELADGRAQLEDGRETLTEAEYDIGYNRVQLEEAEKEVAENRELVESESSKLEDGKKQLEEGQAQLDEQKASLETAQTTVDTVNTMKANAEGLKALMQANMWNDEENLPALEALESGTDQLLAGLSASGQLQATEETEEGWQTPTEGTDTIMVRIETVIAKLDGVSTQLPTQEILDDGFAQIEAAQAEIDASRAQLEDGEKQIKAALKQLDEAEAEIEDGKEQLEDGIRQWQDGMRALSEAEAELLDGEAELADAEAELADGWEEYYDGYAEYEEGYQEFLTEIADAEEKIADAEAELADIEEPETYVLGRETNVGYVCFENDSAIVDGIANVFPVFFYAVAALVCITTMNRMVEEQRTQIGVLKALGYSEAAIMGKYLFYSGAAAISGCLFGYFFGTWFFPKVIWFAYGSMYDVDEILYVFDAGILIFSLIVSALCSMGVTYITCKNELTEVAAELMRPKAPKAGKRVLLERIPFIWKRMKFLHKVSYRNVFRYKKRFFMMVIGISGCTGLIVTGFGVQDSIADIANDQYDRIQVYDVNVMMSEEITEDTDALLEKIADDRMTDYIFTMEKTIDLVTEDSVKSVNLVAIDENEDISPYVVLPDEKTGEILEYPGDGECMLSNKLADIYDLEVGDSVTFRDENNHTMELTLSGIVENYLYNFAYMTTQTYEEYLGEEAEIKSVYINLKEDADPHQFTADMMKDDEIASASVSSDSKNRFTSMIDSLDLLVVVIIACAAFLAFIVLYNLTNINITERIREIATIKVLGFYKNETASYIFRENLILTLIGAIAGLGLGKLFHGFVISQVQVDQIAFDVRIQPMSYLYSMLLTFVFACVVNLFMRKKLDRVSMTESLKSVD